MHRSVVCGSAEGRCVTRSVVCGLVGARSAPEIFREYLGFESSFKMRDYVCGVRSGAVVCPAPIRTEVADRLQKEYYSRKVRSHEKYSETATELHTRILLVIFANIEAFY